MSVSFFMLYFVHQIFPENINPSTARRVIKSALDIGNVLNLVQGHKLFCFLPNLLIKAELHEKSIFDPPCVIDRMLPSPFTELPGQRKEGEQFSSDHGCRRI